MTEAASALNLSASASEQEIKKAFRRLAKFCHPDVVSGQPPNVVDAATAVYLRIQAAQEVLLKHARDRQQSAESARGPQPSAQSEGPREANFTYTFTYSYAPPPRPRAAPLPFDSWVAIRDRQQWGDDLSR